MSELTAVSPIDGRYKKQTEKLSAYFSEMALIRYRLLVEVEYLIALGNEPAIKEMGPLPNGAPEKLQQIYKNFSETDAAAVKEIEQTTNHDVKAVEYFLKENLKKMSLEKYIEFVHFALTSEDVNNLAYSLMWRDALREAYLPAIGGVHDALRQFALDNANEPLLALTHGQSATPTTVGKEFAIFVKRLERQILQLAAHRLLGKLNGATGTWGAHTVAYPEMDWLDFSKKFISSLRLEPNLVTSQIEPHDSLAESYQNVQRLNNILLDFTRDLWLYVSRGVLGQKKKEDEVGSSAMPHKINPINFENAEGNLGLANAYAEHLSGKLPISRLQRDLSDSTVLRNQGIILAHSLIACENILKGMARLTVNKEKLNQELEEHWEILAEAIQTILRKVGYDRPYEKLKELTRGHSISKESMRSFISSLNIPEEEKQKLLHLTPQNYTGLAAKIVNL